MIDVRGNDRSPASHFVANKVRRDVGGNLRAERFARVLKVEFAAVVLCGFERALATQVLANRDELHLRRDDAAPGIMHLRYRMTGLRSQRAAASARKGLETSLVLQQRILASAFGQVAIVLRNHVAAFVLFDVAA